MCDTQSYDAEIITGLICAASLTHSVGILGINEASLMAQWIKKLPAMQETQRCGFNPDLEDSARERNSNLFQYLCLKNPMDRGDWQVIVQRAARCLT